MQSQVLTGVAALATKYDFFVLDLWGTLHDGVQPLPGAIDCLQKLRQTGCRIGILSNAPRRATEIVANMNRIGIPEGLYDFVWSSGEEAWRAISERPDDWYRALGRKCFHIGPARDEEMLDNPGVDRVTKIDEADFILCTGLRQAEHGLADYTPILEDAADRRLKMVCANPDLEVMRGDLREYCAGTLGNHYQKSLGGEVRWHGKPHPPILKNCLTQLGAKDDSATVMVGDTLHTDVAAAAGAGAESIFLLGGIHAKELGTQFGQMADQASLDALYEKSGHTPNVVLPAFIWE